MSHFGELGFRNPTWKGYASFLFYLVEGSFGVNELHVRNWLAMDFFRVVIIFFCINVSVYYLCAVASKHQWNPKNIRANDNCSVRDSKDVCWWTCWNRYVVFCHISVNRKGRWFYEVTASFLCIFSCILPPSRITNLETVFQMTQKISVTGTRMSWHFISYWMTLYFYLFCSQNGYVREERIWANQTMPH